MKNNQLDQKCRLFSRKLMKWHLESNNRNMPWKGEKDPYKIWLSEIILQQTRVEQGWAYYERFLKQFPTIQALAKASDQAVLKCWEGLGYYSRCRNLIHTARFIAFECGGVFPSRYEEILKLKGVGPYTAAAIASFAFNQPYAVVDGNVYRVLARYHGIDKPVDRPEGKIFFQALAQNSLDASQPGSYNQALMDFGATVCKPQSPLCKSCPLNRTCVAYQKDEVTALPVKSPAKPKKSRWFYYLVPEWRGKIPLRMREKGDVWEGLWEPPLIESDQPLRFPTLYKRIQASLPGTWPASQEAFVAFNTKQVLSHQEIHGQFLRCKLDQKPAWGSNFQWVDRIQKKPLPCPRMIQVYWRKTQ